MGLEHDIEAGLGMLVEALDHVGDEPSALRARVLLHLSAGERYRGNLAASEEAARQALAAAEETDDPALLALRSQSSPIVQISRDAHSASCWIARSRLPPPTAPPLECPTVRCLLGEQFLRNGDLSGAREVLEGELRAVVDAGLEPPRAESCETSRMSNRRRATGSSPRGISTTHGRSLSTATTSGARLSSSRGRPGSPLCAATPTPPAGSSRTASARAEAMHWPHLAAMNRWTLGFLELSLGEPARAWAASATLRDFLPGEVWKSSAHLRMPIDTLAALGGLKAVDGLVANARGRSAARPPLGRPAALRSRVLRLLAQGRRRPRRRLWRESRDAFEAAGSRSTAVAHYSSPVKRSAATARAGAPPASSRRRRRSSPPRSGLWAQPAEKELRRRGLDPRDRERRTLNGGRRLVAAGKANREVAAQLFTTVPRRIPLTRI